MRGRERERLKSLVVGERTNVTLTGCEQEIKHNRDSGEDKSQAGERCSLTVFPLITAGHWPTHSRARFA